MTALESAQGADGMNVFAKPTAAGAVAKLDLALFRDAVFKSEFAVYVIRFDEDGTGRFEDANDTVVGIAGRPLKQIVGQRPVDCLPGEIGECLQNKVEVCFASGEPVGYERSVEGPNGPLTFRTHIVPITGRFGKVEHALGMTRDVSQEADQVREAEQNATLLQRLGITLPSAIYLLNLRDLSIRFIGGDPDPERKRWRAQAEEAGDEATRKFFHPDDQEKGKAHLQRLAALDDGEVATIEFRILTESGEYRPHRHRETVMSRNAAGEVELVLGVSEDITDLDLVEKQVRDLSDRLLTSQIDERRRIAEDLHDSTGQHLFAVGLALTRARTSQTGGGDGLENRAMLFEALDDARHSLQVAQREVRMLSYLLHPPEIVSEGLGEAIRNFARGFARRSGHYVQVHIAPEADTIGDDVSLNLFRACQEALTNIYRHAEASVAVIELEVDESTVRLEITDDGVGVDPTNELGVGISGMHERMRRLGGDVQLSGGPDGTTLIVTVPRRQA
jgi:two-component system, NarL family, sensor kinase